MRGYIYIFIFIFQDSFSKIGKRNEFLTFTTSNGCVSKDETIPETAPAQKCALIFFDLEEEEGDEEDAPICGFIRAAAASAI